MKESNRQRRPWTLLVAVASAALGLILFIQGMVAGPEGAVSGVVVDANGPVGRATVRIRATENFTRTTMAGRFTLGSLAIGEKVEVTAWADGYYITNAYVTPTLDTPVIEDITLTLRPYHQVDHPDYQWASPISGTSAGACGNCHPMIIDQWIENAHGTAVNNQRFFSLYNGTNVSGTQSIGPGYLKDFPNTAGSCANCHAPGAGIDGYLTTNMNDVRGEVTAGIHCDYCHKVGGVYLNPATGSVYANAPGAQSQQMLRPPPGDNIFFGPFDDIHDPDTYLPAIRQSSFCAPCHQFSFWGTPIYESYEEWLASPYAEEGVTCQKCHMPPDGEMRFFALPEVGGLEHPPEKLPSHLQLGARHEELLGNTVSMTVQARSWRTGIELTVTITNTQAGHHVPTDFPGRQMILVVGAEDGQGQALPLLSGPTVAAWGGREAGLPGTLYAKLLADRASGQFPVVTYWKQAVIVEDNRIPAREASRLHFAFEAPDSGDRAYIKARLIFRRVFADLAEDKGWDMADITMEEQELNVVLGPAHKIYLPLAIGR